MPAVLSWFGNHAKVVDIGSLNGAWLMVSININNL